MIKTYVLTKQNDNGTYDNVGTLNRTIIKGKCERTMRMKALLYGQGRPVRVEIMDPASFYAPALYTFIMQH